MRLYWYAAPDDDPWVSVIVAVIVVGVPLQSAVGEHETDALAMLLATTSSLTSDPPVHSRRRSEFDTST